MEAVCVCRQLFLIVRTMYSNLNIKVVKTSCLNGKKWMFRTMCIIYMFISKII